ncbi:MAG: MBL fold metallo-hydrolase [Rikenellaceae bacterium]
MAKRNELLDAVRANWSGNRQLDGKFVNIHRKPPAIKSIAKWDVSFNKERSTINFGKSWQPKTVPFKGVSQMPRNSFVWLGHNSFIINVAGVVIVLDPVFGDIPFVKRKSKLPIEPENISDIDLLLLSHDHYDHADKKSVKTLSLANNHMNIISGLGVGELVRSWVPFIKVTEMGWYQIYEHNGVKIVFLPCQHYGKRSVNDSAKRLWGAFLIECDDFKIYYSGDTSYAGHFAEVKELFGDIDYAFMGIGAYKPRWFLERNHMSPIEAVVGAVDMGAKCVIPMHYGTFKLSREPIFDPPLVFRGEALLKGIDFKIPNIGQIVDL